MEHIDLYRSEYCKTDQVIDRDAAVPEDRYKLIVFGCVFNSEGQLLIQQRSFKKKGWPGFWDVSAAGGVMAGESSLDAMVRETKEELGLEVAAEDFVKVLSIYYEDSIHDLYVTQRDVAIEEIRIQEEEVECARWASEEEIVAMMDRGEFIPVYKEFIQLMFRMRDKKGIMI